MVHVMQQRQIFPWLQNEFIFSYSSLKKIYDESLHTLHKFTKDVILGEIIFRCIYTVFQLSLPETKRKIGHVIDTFWL